MKKIKTLSSIFVLIFLFLFSARSALAIAVCPVCTVAVCASLGLSRWLGVDDTLSGVWIGAAILALSLASAEWLKKKKIKIPFAKVIISIISYVSVLVPLYLKKIIGHPLNKFCGTDKLLFGIILGSVLFLTGLILDQMLRKVKHGKVAFYYQKVILPVGLLLIANLVLYFLTKK